jgi:hypothetical protein
MSREATAVVAHRVHLAFHKIYRVKDSAHNVVGICGIVDGAPTMTRRRRWCVEPMIPDVPLVVTIVAR